VAARRKRRANPLEKLRAVCLALPEAEERETWEEATFRIRGKIFAMHIADDGDGRPALWCKAPPGSQTILVNADPARFFVPPYVGHKGWVGMRLGRGVDWREVATLVEHSYRLTAPKRVAALLGEAQGAGSGPAEARMDGRCRGRQHGGHGDAWDPRRGRVAAADGGGAGRRPRRL
jgi:predicted DNA-binding protein (MmcQ/YjbR family)